MVWISITKVKENVTANVLSRVSLLPTKETDEDKGDTIPTHMLTTEILADSIGIAEFRHIMAEDTKLVLLMQAVLNVWPGSRRYCHQLLLDYWTSREEISAENGLFIQMPKTHYT